MRPRPGDQVGLRPTRLQGGDQLAEEHDRHGRRVRCGLRCGCVTIHHNIVPANYTKNPLDNPDRLDLDDVPHAPVRRCRLRPRWRTPSASSRPSAVALFRRYDARRAAPPSCGRSVERQLSACPRSRVPTASLSDLIPTTYDGRQGFSYFTGISRETAGSTGICMHIIISVPAACAKPHYYEHHETTIYVISGQAGMWYGPGLKDYLTPQTGEFLYIPAGMPHLPANSERERAGAIRLNSCSN